MKIMQLLNTELRQAEEVKQVEPHFPTSLHAIEFIRFTLESLQNNHFQGNVQRRSTFSREQLICVPEFPQKRKKTVKMTVRFYRQFITISVMSACDQWVVLTASLRFTSSNCLVYVVGFPGRVCFHKKGNRSWKVPFCWVYIQYKLVVILLCVVSVTGHASRCFSHNHRGCQLLFAFSGFESDY